jgi:hypothetical protein
MPILEHVHERAHDLLKVGNVDNRGIMTWPQREHAKSWGSASWCNGSAGHTFFWLEAAMCYGDAGFLRVAEDSAFVSGETVQQRGPSVCCGYAGQAYSVFAAARSSAETIWYARGLELAELAARNVNSREMNTPERHSLFSGEAGVALLCAAIGEGHAPVLPVIEHGITPIARPHCNNSEREKGSSF